VTYTGPAIELDRAGRTFGDRIALQPLDLAIPPGEIFGLLGPNGSGKTTTLRILATLIRPTAGTARILGHDVVSAPMDVRRQVGVMPEKPSLYERLTVRENLVFWADAHGVRDPGAIRAGRADAGEVYVARHEPYFPDGTSADDPGAIELVPASRPESASLHRHLFRTGE